MGVSQMSSSTVLSYMLIFPIVLSLEPPECRFVLTDSSGNFTSPEYPEDYPNGALCTWEIRADEGKRIRLMFTEFYLEASLECTNDYLEIYDGENFAVYCGRDIPPETESKAILMSIVLFTDGLINLGDRFAAVYEIFEDGGEEPDDSCAYFVDLTNKTTYGFLASPNHPSNYPNNTSCRYDILWERDSDLWARFTQVAFLRFKTVPANFNSSLDSTGDLVRTYRDGIEDSKLVFGGNYQIPAEDPISFLPFVSMPQVSNLSLVFTSDREETDAGFLMAFASEIAPDSSDADTATKMRQHLKKNRKANKKKYPTTNTLPKSVVHMNFISKKISSTNPKYNGLAHFGNPNGIPSAETVDYGFIMSPNHPLEYDASDFLVYNITVPAGKKVAICLLRKNIEEPWDYLSLHDADAEVDDFWYYTGTQSSIPHVWVSPYSNQVLAVFSTDSSVQLTGFLAAVAAVDMDTSAV